ncbi:MAG: STN domain-containing protein [Flavobacteriales bacterium]|nr:STN domain-containing protein [Flavobacteriales bacterium]MBK9535497.1 STN domain-containing protein [Flavobacteriales bacterium]MBP9139689.1 STN domain-containing protein [Flavobacteriales bacterium]HQV53286.1 STN domain-containing protein [Flavobacteriales bacterium]HQX31030.1 STN domain-containing protein [Flavobacteriales bacterium]
MAADLRLFLFVVFLLPVTVFGQKIIERHVEVNASRVRLGEALALVAKDGDFKLSYNSAVVNGDSVVSVNANGTVEEALRTLVGSGFQIKETGEHIILLGSRGDRKRSTISGTIYDADSKRPVLHAYLHEVGGSAMVTTDGSGAFELTVSGDHDRTAILVMRKEYHDTVIYVPKGSAFGQVPMRKRDILERVEPICLYERCQVEDLGVTRLLVPRSELDQAQNITIEEERPWQISLIPNVSTNGPIASAVVNKLSLNILGGYARGLNGLEVGGLANIIGGDVRGMQIAGVTNLVGRNTQGVQIAGGVNHTMRSLEGVQISGLANIVWDTLTGVQISYGVNVVKGGLRGTQISGSCNVATQNVDGMQVSYGVNVTPKDVRKLQIAGTGNYARNVSGAQLAIGVNIARDTVGGGQVGFGGNYARYVTGGQFSFGANIVPRTVSGGQVGFGLNYAGSCTGGQFSFGANIVPGSVMAGQVGFGLNYAGNITGAQFSFGLNAVGGTARGTQVGALNFARKCEGGQVGFLNLSDSLSGFAIGLLSVSLRGYHRFDVITGNVMPLSVQVRTGTKGFHNILGYSPAIEANGRWGFLYGIGTEPRISKNGFMNIDLTAEQIVEQKEWVDAVNIVGRFSLSYGHRIAGPLVISGGAVLNTQFTDWRSAENGLYLSQLSPSVRLFTGGNGATRIYGWIGWKAALGVRF